MANRQNTFLLKRSNVPGKIPQPGDINLGEIALNTADGILYTSGTTQNSILPIGWDRISRTGDTVNGDFNFFGDISISGSSLPNGYALAVTGDTNLGGDVFVQGDLLYNGSMLVTGSTIIQNGLTANTIYTDYIDFNNNLSPIPTNLEGRVFWDEDNGSLTLGMHGSQVSQQIGLEQYYYIKNQSGVTIENGKVVRAAGTLGNSGRILGEYMIADGTIPYYFTLGIATEDILNGEDGYVTEFGLVRGINTTGSLYGETWVDGTILYVSPTISGGLTSVEPIEPNFKIQIAIVIKADNNGSLFVRPSLGYNLGDLHNLQNSGQTNGDLISYNSSQGYWEYTKTLNGSYTITGDTTVGGNLVSQTISTLFINPNNEGNVYFGSTSGLTVDLTNNRVGVNVSNPSYSFEVSGDTNLNGDVLVTGNLTYNGNLIVTGSTIIQSGLTVVDVLRLTTQPNSGYTTTQILMRNSINGDIEITDSTSPSIYNFGMTYAMSTFNYLT
jgi:hypothetical protein